MLPRRGRLTGAYITTLPVQEGGRSVPSAVEKPRSGAWGAFRFFGVEPWSLRKAKTALASFGFAPVL